MLSFHSVRPSLPGLDRLFDFDLHELFGWLKEDLIADVFKDTTNRDWLVDLNFDYRRATMMMMMLGFFLFPSVQKPPRQQFPVTNS